MTVRDESFELKALDFWEHKDILANDYANVTFKADFAFCHKEKYSIPSGEVKGNSISF